MGWVGTDVEAGRVVTWDGSVWELLVGGEDGRMEVNMQEAARSAGDGQRVVCLVAEDMVVAWQRRSPGQLFWRRSGCMISSRSCVDCRWASVGNCALMVITFVASGR